MSDLLQQSVASGQVSAAQIEAHRAAGKMGTSNARKQIEIAHKKYKVDAGRANEANAFHNYAATALSLLPSIFAEFDQEVELLRFDHKDPAVIWPIAEQFNGFPNQAINLRTKKMTWIAGEHFKVSSDDNPATTTALAVIEHCKKGKP